jgi:hypothetical protein
MSSSYLNVDMFILDIALYVVIYTYCLLSNVVFLDSVVPMMHPFLDETAAIMSWTNQLHLCELIHLITLLCIRSCCCG